MSRIENDNFILSSEETRNLINSLKRPSKEMLEKRDAFFKSIDDMNIVDEEDGMVMIEIPGIFSENKNASFKLNTNDKYCYVIDVSINIKYNDDKKSRIIIHDDNYYPIQKKSIEYHEVINSTAA